jgi:transposase
MPAVPDVAGVPSAEELAALPHEELAARLAEAYRVIAGLTARVELLERHAGRDSSTSSKPPSSDSVYRKKPRDRSPRGRGKRQPGEPGTTMKLIDNPDH